ncbi:MAG: SAM-dependent methyltransferase [Oscillospiraceae bacterium]|nr:SAM-dependent methyltransferase [Oscillospiraceae bacterium]
MRSLGNRLELVAEMIHTYSPFRCLADIGSDHAFIAVRAVKNGDAAFAVASDLREGPLEHGRANAASAGVGNIDFRLSDGFDALGDYAFDCACICGMGGELIAEILRRYGPHPDCRFLLQPMTAQDDLRRFLWENGYAIREERFTCERGKPYAILAADFTGEKTAYCYADLFLGQKRPQTDAFRSYAEKTRSQAEKRRTGLLARGMNSSDEDALLAEIDRLLRT